MLKEKILVELNKNEYISGQVLADKFNVSRNAIWKSITSLKNNGYNIVSTNNGYKLEQNNILSIPLIKKDLKYDLDIHIYDEIDSTNDEAKRLLNDKNMLIISNCQTKGKGRQGKSFYSPKDTGIYLSLVLHPNININELLSLTTISSVAIADALTELNINSKIKWVNDIYLDNKKIAGILTEAITNFETMITQSVIIGIGINVSTTNFPIELDQIATSINANIERNTLIAKIINNLMDLVNKLPNKDYIKKYKEYSNVIGNEVIYYINNEQHLGKAIDINDDGSLIINSDNKIITLNSGEISLKIK